MRTKSWTDFLNMHRARPDPHGLDEKFGHIKKKRDHLKGKLQFSNGPDRQKIGAILEKTRSQLKRMPRLSKYQAILKGEDQYRQFLDWAKNDCEVSGHSWLPDKDPGGGFIENKGRSQWLNEYKIRKANRKEKRKWGIWFADHEPYMMAMFADVRLDRMHIPEDKEDSISEYWEYAEQQTK